MSHLEEKFEKEIKPSLMKELGVASSMAAPRLTKIVVNMGIGEALKNKELGQKLAQDLAAITGQKPKVSHARISVAGFNLRAGMPVGLVVTLRRGRMYHFFEKLTSVVLPRLRDFRGVSEKGFDNSGNYTLGILEHTVFPEIDLARVEKPKGFEITFVTNTKDPKVARRLLTELGMPFEKKERKNVH